MEERRPLRFLDCFTLWLSVDYLGSEGAGPVGAAIAATRLQYKCFNIYSATGHLRI
jgi:hypothetical protein